MIEAAIESVRINQKTQQRVIILQTLDQDRYLFIWIAQPEAYAIAVHLQGTQSPRPMTHDLMKSLVEATGASVLRVVVSDLIDEIFYARVVLAIAGTEMEVDARPADAIALAQRTGSPIFVAEHVLDKAGTTLGPSPLPETASDETEQAPPPDDDTEK